MEKSANSGLMALAVSDMFFCAAVIPGAFVERNNFRYVLVDSDNAVNTMDYNTLILC